MTKKIIINPGCARSGTTAMNSYFELLDDVATPFELKEIQAFSNPTLTKKDYFEYFDAQTKKFYFESSPPYVHAGVGKYNAVLKKIHEIFANDAMVVFNLRTMAKRAFSHYWHDISRHYSLHGSSWSVRDKSSSERYKTLYHSSFYEAIAKDYNKFMPDVMEMILSTGKALGWEKVRVIFQSELSNGIENLSNELNIPFKPDFIKRTIGCKAPIFLEAGSYNIVRGGEEKLVDVKPNSLLRLGYDGNETLSGQVYDIASIVDSANSWTSQCDFKSVSAIFERYYEDQRNKLKRVPDFVFFNNTNIESNLFQNEDLKINWEVEVTESFNE